MSEFQQDTPWSLATLGKSFFGLVKFTFNGIVALAYKAIKFASDASLIHHADAIDAPSATEPPSDGIAPDCASAPAPCSPRSASSSAAPRAPSRGEREATASATPW
jgi:hypothetical protein